MRTAENSVHSAMAGGLVGVTDHLPERADIFQAQGRGHLPSASGAPQRHAAGREQSTLRHGQRARRGHGPPTRARGPLLAWTAVAVAYCPVLSMDGSGRCLLPRPRVHEPHAAWTAVAVASCPVPVTTCAGANTRCQRGSVQTHSQAPPCLVRGLVPTNRTEEHRDSLARASVAFAAAACTGALGEAAEVSAELGLD
jgi:hypothetical protein